ncbi:MAG: hypothetical protein FWC81_04025 [Coriobacteriia bacterium]|nr:hypothetical protein [Coriobacteriia bacterium]
MYGYAEMMGFFFIQVGLVWVVGCTLLLAGAYLAGSRKGGRAAAKYTALMTWIFLLGMLAIVGISFFTQDIQRFIEIYNYSILVEMVLLAMGCVWIMWFMATQYARGRIAIDERFGSKENYLRAKEAAKRAANGEIVNPGLYATDALVTDPAVATPEALASDFIPDAAAIAADPSGATNVMPVATDPAVSAQMQDTSALDPAAVAAGQAMQPDGQQVQQGIAPGAQNEMVALPLTGSGANEGADSNDQWLQQLSAPDSEQAKFAPQLTASEQQEAQMQQQYGYGQQQFQQSPQQHPAAGHPAAGMPQPQTPPMQQRFAQTPDYGAGAVPPHATGQFPSQAVPGQMPQQPPMPGQPPAGAMPYARQDTISDFDPFALPQVTQPDPFVANPFAGQPASDPYAVPQAFPGQQPMSGQQPGMPPHPAQQMAPQMPPGQQPMPGQQPGMPPYMTDSAQQMAPQPFAPGQPPAAGFPPATPAQNPAAMGAIDPATGMPFAGPGQIPGGQPGQAPPPVAF